MCARVTVVCVLVSLSVYYRSSAYVLCVCDKLTLPAKSAERQRFLNNADFAKTPSFPSYSLIFTFARPRWPFSIIEVATWQGQLTTITYERLA